LILLFIQSVHPLLVAFNFQSNVMCSNYITITYCVLLLINNCKLTLYYVSVKWQGQVKRTTTANLL